MARCCGRLGRGRSSTVRIFVTKRRVAEYASAISLHGGARESKQIAKAGGWGGPGLVNQLHQHAQSSPVGCKVRQGLKYSPGRFCSCTGGVLEVGLECRRLASKVVVIDVEPVRWDGDLLTQGVWRLESLGFTKHYGDYGWRYPGTR